MCEGEERRRKEVLHGGGGKPVAFLGLSAYKGQREQESSAAGVLCLQRLLLFC